jgi:hypothetical protein
MTPDEAHAICERLGLLELIDAEVAAAPPLSDDQVSRLRALFHVETAKSENRPRRRTGGGSGATTAGDDDGLGPR